jgi:hypothetical protein
MGLTQGYIRFIAFMQRTHRIHGDVLVLSQQAIYADISQTVKMLSENGVVPAEIPHGFDTSNKIPDWNSTSAKKNINVKTLMALLGATSTRTSDISDYEGADLKIDLGVPIDKSRYNQFDAIVDAGTIEHIYDIPQCMENITKMLKVDGVLVLFAPASEINHGFYNLCPCFFFDYLSANGYEDIRVYLKEDAFNGESGGKTYEVMETWAQYGVPPTHTSVVVFARKKKTVVLTRNIIQSAYKRVWNPAERRETALYSIARSFKRFIPDIIYKMRERSANRRYFKYVGWF